MVVVIFDMMMAIFGGVLAIFSVVAIFGAFLTLRDSFLVAIFAIFIEGGHRLRPRLCSGVTDLRQLRWKSRTFYQPLFDCSRRKTSKCNPCKSFSIHVYGRLTKQNSGRSNMSEVLDVALKIEFDSKLVHHAAILRKVVERDTPKTIFTDSRE
jgi:hypothetical protein